MIDTPRIDAALAALGATSVLNVLAEVPEEIHVAMQAYTAAERAVELYDMTMVIPMRQAHDVTVITASMKAPQDGKNAEARKIELEHYLQNDDQVLETQRGLAMYQKRRAEMAYNVEQAKVTLLLTQNRFKAALAMAGLLSKIPDLLNGE